MKGGELIVGLDVGTTKICVVVGEVKTVIRSNGDASFRRRRGSASNSTYKQVDIVGIGSAPSRGIKKGVVVNMEEIVESIKKAVEDAESMAGASIRAVYVGITGRHIDSIQSNGVIAVKEKEITQKDVDRVIDAARAVAIPFDREILHVIPVGFTVNGQNGIYDPRGMEGVRLEANVQIITGAATSVHNLVKSCQRAGLEVIDVVFGPFASAAAVLSQEEMELGVAVIDIGGGTTDIVLFHEGNICHTAVLSLGGNNFTNDIAIGLRTLAQDAEGIKKRYGSSMLSIIKEDQEIEVSYSNDRPVRKVPRRHLVEILQPRAEELFGLIKEEIRGKGFHSMMISGAVLTGGAALMEGMDVMAENILELPVRIGSPRGIGGITDVVCSPVYTAGVGLVLYGAEGLLRGPRQDDGNMLKGMIIRVKEWVRETFRL